MFTSSADVFRRRQVVSDLNSVVRAHQNAMSRLGTTEDERAAIRKIVAAGCIVTDPNQDRLLSQLLLTAALPDDDFTAFIAATAILVANRLMGGQGDDDLFWNWDAFHDHFRLAEPPVRAALMNGFRLMDRSGLVTLDGGPTDQDCLSRSKTDVLSALGESDASDLASAIVADATPVIAGQLWSAQSHLNLPASSLHGFRFLFERPLSIQPEHAAVVPVIPWG